MQSSASRFECGNRLIAALDVEDGDEAFELWRRLEGVPALAKIGLELFLREGPQLVRAFVSRGIRVMLDLKLHDIPETVGRSVRQLSGLGVALCTVHVDSEAMLAAAVSAATQATTPMGVLGVTVLTSNSASDLAALNVQGDLVDVVVNRAKLAERAGCIGVVASAQEASAIRASVGSALLIVTPGIRLRGGAHGDQKRVVTPTVARSNGADLIVVGRPLRDADNPAVTARQIVTELQNGAQ